MVCVCIHVQFVSVSLLREFFRGFVSEFKPKLRPVSVRRVSYCSKFQRTLVIARQGS